ncbi:hypothetical protein D3C79_825610 [compost metagenome]
MDNLPGTTGAILLDAVGMTFDNHMIIAMDQQAPALIDGCRRHFKALAIGLEFRTPELQGAVEALHRPQTLKKAVLVHPSPDLVRRKPEHRAYGDGFNHAKQVLHGLIGPVLAPVLDTVVHLGHQVIGGIGQHRGIEHRDEQRYQIEHLQADAFQGFQQLLALLMIDLRRRYCQHQAVLAPLQALAPDQLLEQLATERLFPDMPVDAAFKLVVQHCLLGQRRVAQQGLPECGVDQLAGKRGNHEG